MSNWLEEFVKQHQTIGKLKKTTEAMGKEAGKILQNLDKSEKEVEEKIKKILESVKL